MQLSPVPQPVGLFDAFIARRTETLVLKEKIVSLSGDDFEIKLASGQSVLRVEGKVMSISDRKKVFDMGGRHLFDIRKEHLHLHSTYSIEDAQEKKIMEVKFGIQLIGSKAAATFTNPRTQKRETLTMSGDWLSKKADIVDETTGFVVARIDRKILNAREWLADQQTYGVVVAPGVDMALMAALCICLDEKKNEGH